MIIPAASDVAFSIFGFSIYWYGIIMACAIFVGVMCANVFFNYINPDLKKDIILEFSPIIIILGILCARLYYCCLNSHYYFKHFWEIFDIREGGLSIHGAIIGGILSVIFIIKKYKIPVFKLLDSMAVATILGQSIGRWGNYFNSEAYGIPVQNQNWGLFIPAQHRITGFENYTLFHPTFLYESILDLFGFCILTFVLFKFGKSRTGLTFFLYLFLYGIIRFGVEILRVDSALNISFIPIASIVSVTLIIFGITGILYICKKT